MHACFLADLIGTMSIKESRLNNFTSSHFSRAMMDRVYRDSLRTQQKRLERYYLSD